MLSSAISSFSRRSRSAAVLTTPSGAVSISSDSSSGDIPRASSISASFSALSPKTFSLVAAACSSFLILLSASLNNLLMLSALRASPIRGSERVYTSLITPSVALAKSTVTALSSIFSRSSSVSSIAVAYASFSASLFCCLTLPCSCGFSSCLSLLPDTPESVSVSVSSSIVKT